MILQSIRIYNFRNLAEQKLSFSPRVNFFQGNNGQGKTNVVEAIHALAYARSFRWVETKELLRWGEENASIFGDIGEANEAERLELGVVFTKGKKELFVNEKKVSSLIEYLGKLAVVVFSPGDLMLVQGAPQLRRRFIDKHLVDYLPHYTADLLSLHKILKTKASVLRKGMAERTQIETLNKLLAELSVKVWMTRKEFLKKLQLRASLYMQSISPSDGLLFAELKTSVRNEESMFSADVLFRELNSIFEREAAAKACLVGPHRDDLVLTLGGVLCRSFASQGQARSVVLALKLAVLALIEEQRSHPVVLILDDVDSELDGSRRENLFSEVEKSERQVFITGTDFPEECRGMSQKGYFFEVNQGKILQISPIHA